MVRFLPLAIAGMLSLPVECWAGEDYYVLVFGSQQIPNRPNYSHSFATATFVRASWPGDGPCPQGAILEDHTISWLPANMKVRTRALLPECGQNFDLHTTIDFCRRNHMRVSLWGAYQTCPDFYLAAMKHLNLLESGEVRYKAVDSGYPTDRVSNCIHAVSSVAGGYRLRVASPGFGEMASYAVLRRYEPFIIDRETVHPWVGSALGLDEYPIIYRDWQSPRSGAIFGPVSRLFGGERDLIATYGPPDPDCARSMRMLQKAGMAP